MLVAGDQSPDEVFRVSADEVPGERVGAGETAGTTNPFLDRLADGAEITAATGERLDAGDADVV